MSKRLYGRVTKENVEYEWKSEPGACEICKAMDGTIYQSANDIPDRPHPNCKCWIDVLEKEKDTKDPIELHREKIKDRKRNELEVSKLLGDAKSLEEEIDEYIRQINEQEKELNNLEEIIEIEELEPKYGHKVKNVQERINYAKYKADKAKQETIQIKNNFDDTQNTEDILSVLDKLYYDFKYAKVCTNDLISVYNKIKDEIKNIKEDCVKIIENITIDKMTKNKAIFLGSLHSQLHNMSESYELFKLALKTNNYNQDYVNKNGKLYKSIDSLNNNSLIHDIRARIKEEKTTNQKIKTDCKVLVLNYNSSISKAIERSHELSRFLAENMRKLKNGARLSNQKIEFSNLDIDLYSSLHGAIVKEAYLDSEDNLIMIIEDYYNFNPGRTSVKGRIGEKLQQQGELENYYIIIHLKIPKTEWIQLKV